MIRPVYKPIGPSTHQLAMQAASIFPKKLTHTGSLDPLAHGVVTLLIGDARYHKQSHQAAEKSYRVEIIGGIRTDTHDLMGRTTTQSSIQSLPRKRIETFLESQLGTHPQQLPRFSARRIDGESYFDKAKRGEEFTPAHESVTLQRYGVVNIARIEAPRLIADAIQRIQRVQGDFRQAPIIEAWQRRDQHRQPFPSITLELTVGKRFYIRALVRDLSDHLNIPLCIADLERTADGDRTTADCICLL